MLYLFYHKQGWYKHKIFDLLLRVFILKRKKIATQDLLKGFQTFVVLSSLLHSTAAWGGGGKGAMILLC